MTDLRVTTLKDVPDDILVAVQKEAIKWDWPDVNFNSLGDIAEYIQEVSYGETRKESDYIYTYYEIKCGKYHLSLTTAALIKDRSICDSEWDGVIYIIDKKAAKERRKLEKEEKLRLAKENSSKQWQNYFRKFSDCPKIDIMEDLSNNYKFPEKW